METKAVDTGVCCRGRVSNQIEVLLLVFNASHHLATAIYSNLNLHFTPMYSSVPPKLECSYALLCFLCSCVVLVSSLKCLLCVSHLLSDCEHVPIICAYLFNKSYAYILLFNMVNISKA